MEGVGTPEAIDTVMKLGMNHPMGPLTLADFIGLDVCLAILDVLHDGLGDPKYRPCPLLRRMVAAGHLGRKSGRGFYQYLNSHCHFCDPRDETWSEASSPGPEPSPDAARRQGPHDRKDRTRSLNFGAQVCDNGTPVHTHTVG